MNRKTLLFKQDENGCYALISIDGIKSYRYRDGLGLELNSNLDDFKTLSDFREAVIKVTRNPL